MLIALRPVNEALEDSGYLNVLDYGATFHPDTVFRRPRNDMKSIDLTLGQKAVRAKR